jgi:hypothetical protein
VGGLSKLDAARAQLRWLGAVSNDQRFRSRLTQLGPDATQETLALLLAETGIRKQIETNNLVSDLLFGVIRRESVQGGKCEGYIRSRASRCGFHTDPEILADFRSAAIAGVIRFINQTVVAPNLELKTSALELATSDSPPYVASNFFTVLKSAVADVIDSFLRAEDRLEENLDEVAPEGPEGSGFDDIEALLLRADIEAAVRRLPPNLRRAMELRFFEGLKIHSDDKDEETVQKKMGVTARTVGNYLAAAYAILRRTLDHP